MGSLNVLESVNSCDKAVMLSCYGTDENGNPIIKDDCPQLMDPENALKYFNYGPAEWIWRSLTYQKMQPFMIKN